MRAKKEQDRKEEQARSPRVGLRGPISFKSCSVV
jgi:hypothetical protein